MVFIFNLQTFTNIQQMPNDSHGFEIIQRDNLTIPDCLVQSRMNLNVFFHKQILPKQSTCVDNFHTNCQKYICVLKPLHSSLINSHGRSTVAGIGLRLNQKTTLKTVVIVELHAQAITTHFSYLSLLMGPKDKW